MSTSVTPTLADSNRAANATVLIARHLVDRAGKHIHARQVDGKLTWLVESQTQPGRYYTVIRISDGWPVDACDCEDCAYRHQTCKHLRAVNELSPVPQPAAAPRKVRRERVEEI
jgi:hypothetical protein